MLPDYDSVSYPCDARARAARVREPFWRDKHFVPFDVKLQQQHSRHDEKTTTHWTGTLPCAVRLARFHAQPVWHVSMRRPSDDTQDRIANTLVGVASPLDMQNRIASTLVGVASPLTPGCSASARPERSMTCHLFQVTHRTTCDRNLSRSELESAKRISIPLDLKVGRSSGTPRPRGAALARCRPRDANEPLPRRSGGRPRPSPTNCRCGSPGRGAENRRQGPRNHPC